MTHRWIFRLPDRQARRHHLHHCPAHNPNPTAVDTITLLLCQKVGASRTGIGPGARESVATGCPALDSEPVLQAPDLVPFLAELEQWKQLASFQVPTQERGLVLLCDVSF